MPSRASAVAVLLVLLAACGTDATSPAPELDDPASRSGGGGNGATASGSPTACTTCTFEPRLFTRRTGTPVTEVVTFAGNPAGAYTIEINDLGSRGANSTVELNGNRIEVPNGYLKRDVVLDWQNTLHVRLTGKPGSQLSVRVWQEIASITVTPGVARSRMPATLQFAAVARDRNGVEIPGQTFTWASDDPTIATIDNATGLATTRGPVHNMAAFYYKTTSTGEGSVAIVATPDGTPGMTGAASWTVVSGFVYITFQAALPLASPNRASRPASVPYRYDIPRLQSMASTCAAEAPNTAWRPQAIGGIGERLFKQCYPVLEHETPTRNWVPATPFTDGFYIYGSDNNVGLYGRYCGGGQPDGEWWDLARNGNYQPKDPIDALCMDHDRQEALHEMDPTLNAAGAACIVRYGIDTERLYEEGVRILPGSARWNAFWSSWPQMAVSREHWLSETSKLCFGPVYTKFLNDRGLTV